MHAYPHTQVLCPVVLIERYVSKEAAQRYT
jgi:hypothetical protein